MNLDTTKGDEGKMNIIKLIHSFSYLVEFFKKIQNH